MAETTDSSGERPANGGTRVSDDEWFCSLPEQRKTQIRGWLDKPAPPPGTDDPEQLDMLALLG